MIQAMQEQTAALVEALRQPSAPVDYEVLAAAIAQAIAPLVSPQIVSSGQPEVSSGHQNPVIETIYTREVIVEKGKRYTRDTHALLFAVVDWMEADEARRALSVRGIASDFEVTTGQSVSKSWAAVAKNYWLSKQAKGIS